jgi:rRNA-processing protein FCF1
MDILCDTSFLIVLVSAPIKQNHIVESHFGKLNFLVPDIVIDELKHLEKWAGQKRSKLSSTAIKISYSKFNIVKIFKSENVDKSLIEYAVSHGCAIATIDRGLRMQCITNNIPVITFSRNKLTVAAL